MLDFIYNIFKTPQRLYPKQINKNNSPRRIVSYLSNGNVLLQQSKYHTFKDIQKKKKDIFSYFHK
jgi:hypothetical protein